VDLKKSMEEEWKVDYGTTTTLTNVTDDGLKVVVTFSFLDSVSGTVPADPEPPKTEDKESKMAGADNKTDDDEDEPYTDTEKETKDESDKVDEHDSDPEKKADDEDKVEGNADKEGLGSTRNTEDEDMTFKEDDKELDQKKLKQFEEDYFDKEKINYLDEMKKHKKSKYEDDGDGGEGGEPDEPEKYMDSPFAVEITTSKGDKTICYHCSADDGELRVHYVEFYDGKRLDSNSFFKLPKPLMRDFELVAREEFLIKSDLTDFITMYNAFRKRRLHLTFLKEARDILAA